MNYYMEFGKFKRKGNCEFKARMIGFNDKKEFSKENERFLKGNYKISKGREE